ncbi:MAG: 16S rRNA (adenine(1518)-N(6)/adenine(1519)-N(6))-dimethyltransferase RsmA [Pseudomonadota bacterium]
MVRARKRFGQHFLHDAHVIDQLCLRIQAYPDDRLVEIGPGLGALTTALLPISKKMDVIEIDRDLIPKLRARCAKLGELHIHEMDALECDFSVFAQEKKIRVVGNLPYNISTPLLFHLFTYIDYIKDMYFMFQKEVVDRLAAPVATADYGRLSVMAQYYCDVEPLFSVSADAFLPSPKVESAVLRLVPKKPTLVANNLVNLKKVVATAFQQRRKTIRNSLKNMIAAERLSALDIDPNLRPADLTVDNYVRISNTMEKEKE